MTTDFTKNYDELQYITNLNLTGTVPGKRFILGTIDQKTSGITFTADLNLTPEFSIQYYGSPFISRGTFSELKRTTDPEAGNYEDRFTLYENPVLADNIYNLKDTDGGTPVYYSIANPDFNFHQFRSNLVARWEYRLGSYIYLVWSASRPGSNNLSESTLGESYSQLSDLYPNNIFLIKLNYWFSL